MNPGAFFSSTRGMLVLVGIVILSMILFDIPEWIGLPPGSFIAALFTATGITGIIVFLT